MGNVSNKRIYYNFLLLIEWKGRIFQSVVATAHRVQLLVLHKNYKIYISFWTTFPNAKHAVRISLHPLWMLQQHLCLYYETLSEFFFQSFTASCAPCLPLAVLHRAGRSPGVCALARRWRRLCQHTNTPECNSNTVTWTEKCHNFSFCFCVLIFPRLWTEEAIGTSTALIFSCCSLFLFFSFLFFSLVVTSLTVSPSYFIKSFCQAGNPALLHYSYSAMETGESEVPTTALMTCKDGVKTVQRLHLLSQVLPQLLWSSSWT